MLGCSPFPVMGGLSLLYHVIPCYTMLYPHYSFVLFLFFGKKIRQQPPYHLVSNLYGESVRDMGVCQNL